MLLVVEGVVLFVRQEIWKRGMIGGFFPVGVLEGDVSGWGGFLCASCFWGGLYYAVQSEVGLGKWNVGCLRQGVRRIR